MLLRMTESVNVHIIGAPIACKEGIKDTWRQVADWAGRQADQLSLKTLP